ncbi:hypothetical protein [Actibacterium pelagium]|uniref:Uncharacterized protein n=1 Tax=Actibacterium pelagium TaxID=2029103 RepID=A0A917AAK8_9RHOB|nr:hypothetical protein [Actibacterium pelagium]GGE37376.1 hypothetical protein GCM10011517_01390 [Actibacterium pelagium]
MTIDTQAISVLSSALEGAARRSEAERNLQPGIDAVLSEIDATVLPRRLTFTSGEAKLVILAGSGRLLRMVNPSVPAEDDRKAQLAKLAQLLRQFPADTGQTVLSEHLSEDVAAEEVGFSASELREGLEAAPEEDAAETASAMPETADLGTGLRGFYDGLDAVAVGQAFLLPNWEEIEIAGGDILPETDEDMGQLLSEISVLRDAIQDLCGEQAILMGHDGAGIVSIVTSPEGEVISVINKADPTALVERWQQSCQKDEG